MISILTRKKFAVKFYLKNGQVITIPKGDLEEFSVKKNGLGETTQFEWKYAENHKTNILKIDIDEVVAVITEK